MGEGRRLVFQPEQRPRVLKTNINKITRHLVQRIAGKGFDVYISYSNKSQSRYLEIMLENNKKMVVRLSNHPADRTNRWRYKFDIHTIAPRRGSVDYIEFLDAFSQIMGQCRKPARNIKTSAKEKV